MAGLFGSPVTMMDPQRAAAMAGESLGVRVRAGEAPLRGADGGAEFPPPCAYSDAMCLKYGGSVDRLIHARCEYSPICGLHSSGAGCAPEYLLPLNGPVAAADLPAAEREVRYLYAAPVAAVVPVREIDCSYNSDDKIRAVLAGTAGLGFPYCAPLRAAN